MDNPTDSEIIKEIIKALDVNPSKFARTLGYNSAGTIHHIISGKNSISKSMADKTVEAYPRVNYSYITMGKGDPLLTPEQQVSQNNMFDPSVVENSKEDLVFKEQRKQTIILEEIRDFLYKKI